MGREQDYAVTSSRTNAKKPVCRRNHWFSRENTGVRTLRKVRRDGRPIVTCTRRACEAARMRARRASR